MQGSSGYLFLLEWVLAVWKFQEMCPLYLSCLIYWHQVVHDKRIILLTPVESVVMSPLTPDMDDCLFFFSWSICLNTHKFYWSQRISFWFSFIFSLVFLLPISLISTLLFPFFSHIGFHLIFFYFLRSKLRFWDFFFSNISTLILIISL